MSTQDLNQFFHRAEFRCPCGCGKATADFELVEVLTFLRTYFGEPVYIHRGGGYRCEAYNAKIGGAQKSAHCEGLAADISIRNVALDALYLLLDGYFPDKYGFGLYKAHVHVDVRDRRWRDDDCQYPSHTNLN